MPWARIDDDIMTNPKIMSVGAEAKLLHLFGIVHCSKNLTDGFVSEKIAPTLGRFAGIGDYDTAVVQLVEAGLWDEAEGGYNVHDYLEYNYSKAEIETLREERKEAGRRGGQAKASKSLALAKQKPSTCLANPIALAKQKSSTCLANPIALAKQKSSKTLAKSYPITHNPLPINEETKRETSAAADGADAPHSKTPNQTFLIFKAYCEGIGIDPSKIPKVQWSGYLKQASGILAAGYTADDVRECTRATKADRFWQDKALHLRNVAEALPQWKKGGSNGASRQRSSEAESDPSLDRFKAFD